MSNFPDDNSAEESGTKVGDLGIEVKTLTPELLKLWESYPMKAVSSSRVWNPAAPPV